MKKAFIKLHISIILAGFTGIFGKLITLNEGLLAWYRIALAGLFLLIILSITRKLQAISLRQAAPFALAGFFIGMHWIFFYGSIKYANISVGVVCFSLTGFFTAIVAPLINKQKFSWSELSLSLLTLAGIILIFSFDTRYRLGIFLGFISSLLASLFTISNERLARKHPSETVLVYSMLGGAVSLIPVLVIYCYWFPSISLIPSFQDLGYLMILVVFCTVLLYLLQTQVLRQLSAFTVNLSLNLEPVYTIILAILLYEEDRELSPAFYTGLGLIMLSVLLQMLLVIRANKKAQKQVMNEQLE
ncbi:DMT family transporter [Siphonobacter sp. SORGH_AS_1065]|uniref:DMT family transporter n=1 Tax=Siphonobacter sp. SORGH_AS_1065 TaxID=3041795 RepID=UPI00278A47D4|nr:DMT family transporter [Siphonobacter sp. SORGH_AS_1065]MDQ1089751.1 drug/metabolite transporter (DMT)-like permease [Siphonobacter sp. SORGH_AS_1065]